MDKFGQNFFESLKKELSIEYECLIAELDQQSSELVDLLGESLTVQMENLKKLYECSSHGPACHVVISYLRTGLLDRHPLYSIAMYDDAFLLSENECAVMWDIPEISNTLYKIIDKATERFQRQSKVPSYYLDEIIANYSDQLNEWFMKYLPQIIGSHLNSGDWKAYYKQNSMRISAGEYRNNVKRIFEWRD